MQTHKLVSCSFSISRGIQSLNSLPKVLVSLRRFTPVPKSGPKTLHLMLSTQTSNACRDTISVCRSQWCWEEAIAILRRSTQKWMTLCIWCLCVCLCCLIVKNVLFFTFWIECVCVCCVCCFHMIIASPHMALSCVYLFKTVAFSRG